MKWEENVRKVVPYVPGEQPKRKDIIKLNTNECPYPPSPLVKKALEDFTYDDLRLYPDPDAAKLVESLANTYHVKPENVFVGVGSDYLGTVLPYLKTGRIFANSVLVVGNLCRVLKLCYLAAELGSLFLFAR